MTKLKLTILATLIAVVAIAQVDLSKKIPGIAYEKEYNFTAGVEMVMEFYNKKGTDFEPIPYFSYYDADLNYLCIKHHRGNTVYQTVFDFPNNNCLILLGEGNQIMGSASVMKEQDESSFKKLALTETDESKEILGYTCKKYTFETPKFNGELWATTELNLKNDVGVLKASKMGKYYQVVPVEGFVLEITSITTKKGRKTVMKTTTIKPEVSYQVNIPDEFGAAINKVDYYGL